MNNVLITAVGTGIGQSIIKSLKMSPGSYRLVGTDISPWSAGLYLCDKGYIIPRADDINYTKRIREIILKESIDIVIAGCDPEVEILSMLEPRLKEDFGVEVLTPPYKAVGICRNKYSTVQFLVKNGFLCPKTVNLVDAEELIEEVGFPIVVKPKSGSGTSRVQVIFSKRELELYRVRSGDAPFNYVAQEYLVPEGKTEVKRKDVYKYGLLNQTDEYSTEVLVSKFKEDLSSGLPDKQCHTEVLGAITNWRTMKKGYPIRAIVDSYPKVTEKAVKVVKALIKTTNYVGPCNLQSRITKDGVAFFEINPRFSGSTAVRSVAGFNGPHILTQNFLFGSILHPKKINMLGTQALVEIRFWNELYLTMEEFSHTVRNKESNVRGRIFKSSLDAYI